MTMQATDTLHVIAGWLSVMPLPEPSSAGVEHGVPQVTWTTGADAARDIVEALGPWLTMQADPDRVHCYVSHLGTPIHVTVQAPGVVALATGAVA